MADSAAPRWGCSLALMGVAIAAVIGLNVVWQTLSDDVGEAAGHFLEVVRRRGTAGAEART